ncbi:acyltransferase family protein [Candidatus Nitrosacidococcus sp. I8]|uniref:acyltransferase family protein n=2 Tax=Candidatus Nitrosacidococcus sp. I8 TaxID=2942908 RepID=UPI002226728B|nr:acyltransferase family protein [Candidatus Nitrosacidococcus sp. I8]CAH9018088.1 hypothetical protein NURINAE_00718 [Candidatus Nitrosacidococcus sp. I8]
MHTAHKYTYRPDIDGLRALAVLAVIAYHYEYAKSLLTGGFIGVDIFFVISGYLITGILLKEFKTHSFSIIKFYQRRIRRIFPALIVILLFSLIIGWVFYLENEYQKLGQHIATSAGFIQNFMLWSESGYFDLSSIQKPLLHLWSLSVEEQFYIFWPLILWAILHYGWSLTRSITIIISLSFLINLGYAYYDKVIDFYFPTTRAWELMAGAYLAAIHYSRQSLFPKYSSLQSWLGLGLILIGFITIHPDYPFPGIYALLPILGTVLLINAGPDSVINRYVLSSPIAIWVGLISYPLYLWHWALWSFFIVIVGDIRGNELYRHALKIAAPLLSFLLAWLTYKYLEKPIRSTAKGKSTLVLLTSVVIIGVAGLVIFQKEGISHRPFKIFDDRAGEYIRSTISNPIVERCSNLYRKATYPEKWFCTLGDPQAEIWIMTYGDSHAQSMIPAFDHYGKENHVRILLTSGDSCLPLLEIEIIDYPHCSSIWEKVAEFVKDKKPAAITLVAQWTIYDNNLKKPRKIKILHKPKELQNIEYFKYGLTKTLTYYSSLGISILLLEDNPQQRGNPPLNVLRFNLVSNRDILEQKMNGYAISLETHLQDQKQINSILKNIASYFPNTYILNTYKALCNSMICPWAKEGQFLYFDYNHLTTAGSMLVYPLLKEKLNAILNIH